MWHDDLGDEGEDGPEPGPLPDPSARHWRHPSELRDQHALPDPRPTAAVAATASTSSPVWPTLAVGGVLAVVAIGVLGLQASLRDGGSLEADGATSLTAPQTATSRPEQPTPVVNLETTVTTARPTSTVARSITTSAELGAVRSTSLWAAESPELALAGPALSAENARAYGIYTRRGSDAERLASFVAVAGEVVTSASALGPNETVWLRIESDWREAWLIGIDPLTDVAVLEVADGEIPLPWLEAATEPIAPGSAAMIGYGEPESDTHASTDPTGGSDRLTEDGGDNGADGNPSSDGGDAGDNGRDDDNGDDSGRDDNAGGSDGAEDDLDDGDPNTPDGDGDPDVDADGSDPGDATASLPDAAADLPSDPPSDRRTRRGPRPASGGG